MISDTILEAHVVEKVNAVSEALNLGEEQARRFLNSAHYRSTFHPMQKVAEYDAMLINWGGQANSDAEIGLGKLISSKESMNAVLARLGTPDLILLLNETGLIGHPEFIRIFSRAGKLINDAAYVPPKQNLGFFAVIMKALK